MRVVAALKLESKLMNNKTKQGLTPWTKALGQVRLFARPLTPHVDHIFGADANGEDRATVHADLANQLHTVFR